MLHHINAKKISPAMKIVVHSINSCTAAKKRHDDCLQSNTKKRTEYLLCYLVYLNVICVQQLYTVLTG